MTVPASFLSSFCQGTPYSSHQRCLLASENKLIFVPVFSSTLSPISTFPTVISLWCISSYPLKSYSNCTASVNIPLALQAHADMVLLQYLIREDPRHTTLWAALTEVSSTSCRLCPALSPSYSPQQPHQVSLTDYPSSSSPSQWALKVHKPSGLCSSHITSL